MPESKLKAKLFNIKLFPMDLARVVCALLPLLFRLKKVTPTGEKYREVLRGGAVIAANHTSFADPLVVGVTFWYRRMFFLVADVVMKGRVVSALLRGAGAIKIKREIADVEAIKKSVDVLKQGQLLTVFPQGRIVKDDDVENIKSGAVLMALQAGVPIIPMHIFKREHWYSRRKVVIGNAIDPKEICKKKMPTTNDIKEITDILMEEMSRCAANGGK